MDNSRAQEQEGPLIHNDETAIRAGRLEHVVGAGEVTHDAPTQREERGQSH